MKLQFLKPLQLLKTDQFKKYFLSYLRFMLMLFMIPFILFVTTVYFSYNRIVGSEIENTHTQSFLKTSISLEKMLNDIQKKFYLISVNPYVDIFISKPRGNQSNLDISLNTQMIYDNFSEFMNYKEYLESIFIYSPSNGYVFSTEGSAQIDKFADTAWYDAYLRDGSDMITVRHSKDKKELLSIIYAIKSGSADTLNGLVVFNINSEALKNVLVSEANKAEKLYLFNNAGEIIFSTEAAQLGKNVEDDVFLSQYKSNDFDKPQVYKKNGNITIFKSIRQHGICIASTIPVASIAAADRRFGYLLIILIIFSLLLSLFLPLYSIIRLYNSISTIIAQIWASSDEDGESIGSGIHINDSIMSIMDRYSSIETELMQKNHALKKAQTVALQTQINPHFLFNTLNSVNVIITKLTKGDNDASTIICLLSDILRDSLNTTDSLITVQREVEYAKKYVAIESIKHQSSFDVVWSIDEDTKELCTLKMVLQPVIENAIQHGVKMLTDRHGEITVECHKDSEALTFTVTNNGPEITAEKLENIRSGFSSALTTGKHIGLANVDQRIKIIFGTEYGVCINSDADKTKVKITMPATKPVIK